MTAKIKKDVTMRKVEKMIYKKSTIILIVWIEKKRGEDLMTHQP